MKHGDGKSDSPVVPEKPPNNEPGAPGSAEGVEERGLAEGKTFQLTRPRTQSRVGLQRGMERIRQASERIRKEGGHFTALWHHVYDVERLREAYYGVNRQSAPGIDRVTWQQYGEDLETRLADLSTRLQRGSYKARAVRRAYVPKDGGQRPIGVPVLEDKIVQRSFAEVIGAVYESEFLGFSYGFRRGRSPHRALDALTVALERKKVNWVLDADIRGYFEAIDHEWLAEFLQHRVADRRVLRQVRKWLRAGVLEEGEVEIRERGTPQGGSVSPLLANLYLHYVFDLWAHQWRQRHARGDVIIVRYADDFVVGFQHRGDAERFLEELRERFRRFHLELHADKTRLIEFGRYAAERRKRRGSGKPQTFDFLGFTHICGRDRGGRFIVRRRTMRKRVRAKLKAVKAELRRRRHEPIPAVGRWLEQVLTGHYRYYGVPRNYGRLATFRDQVAWLWRRELNRRSQRARMTWERMRSHVRRWLPRPKIYHPYPNQRLCVTT